MIMLLLPQTTGYLNYQKHTARQLLPGSWCLWNIKQHLNPRAAALHNAVAFRLYSKNGTPEHQGRASTQNPTTEVALSGYGSSLHGSQVGWGMDQGCEPVSPITTPRPSSLGERRAGFRKWRSKSEPRRTLLPEQRQEFFLGCASSQLLDMRPLVEACRILRLRMWILGCGLHVGCPFPDQAPNPGPLHRELGGSLTHWTTS